MFYIGHFVTSQIYLIIAQKTIVLTLTHLQIYSCTQQTADPMYFTDGDLLKIKVFVNNTLHVT